MEGLNKAATDTLVAKWALLAPVDIGLNESYSADLEDYVEGVTESLEDQAIADEEEEESFWDAIATRVTAMKAPATTDANVTKRENIL
jgi:hypothetical protein